MREFMQNNGNGKEIVLFIFILLIVLGLGIYIGSTLSNKSDRKAYNTPQEITNSITKETNNEKEENVNTIDTSKPSNSNYNDENQYKKAILAIKDCLKDGNWIKLQRTC